MASVIVNFKTDKKVKEKAQKIAQRAGLNLSDILNVYLRTFVVSKGLYIRFEENEEKLNSSALAALRQAEDDYRRGKTSPAFKSAKEASLWLKRKKRRYESKV